MEKLAIDIALIPEKKIRDLAITLNKDLVKQDSKLVLGEYAVPHITLTQGVIDKKQINNIDTLLKNIVPDYRKMNLVAEDILIGPMSNSVWLKIRKTEELDKLHRQLNLEMKSYLSYKVDKSMFANPNDVEDKVLNWVKDFPAKSRFENYQPHITLGFGKIENPGFPVEFNASKLTMYQLGNYCTCHTEILSYNL